MPAAIMKQNVDPEFPCSLIIKTPFPTHRLASTALQALEVDAELSPLVRRKFSLVTPPTSPISTASNYSRNSPDSDRVSRTNPTPSLPTIDSITKDLSNTNLDNRSSPTAVIEGRTVLLTEYRAKTNRMLRVAVNGFMESLGVVLGVMERLDVDVMAKNKAPGSAVAA